MLEESTWESVLDTLYVGSKMLSVHFLSPYDTIRGWHNAVESVSGRSNCKVRRWSRDDAIWSALWSMGYLVS